MRAGATWSLSVRESKRLCSIAERIESTPVWWAPSKLRTGHGRVSDPCCGADRGQPEFREMFFDIWAARPGTKLLKIWAQMGLDQRSDPQFRAVERVRRPLKTDHSDRRRRGRGEIAPGDHYEDQNTVFPT